MITKKASLFASMLCTLLVFCVVLSALAETPRAQPYKQGTALTAAQSRDRYMKLAEMMSSVMAAQHLLEIRQPTLAGTYIMQARDIAAQLSKAAPSLAAEGNMRFSKTRFVYEGATQDYMVPLVDNRLVVKDYDVILQKRRDARVGERDSNVAVYRFDIDVAAAAALITQASDRIKLRDRVGAMRVLSEIYKGALTEELFYRDPLWAVHDNLVIALHQLRYKSFQEALFVLQHASNGLDAYKERAFNTQEGTFQQEADRLKSDIVILRAELGRADPSYLPVAEGKLSTWIGEVATWAK